ncbi:hypothetical protein T12_2067 [Trichinella patagoniensis]|uniref:Uncharacterized protein n=1 Tax=Trichinella patagoniensis TaxID=990121 RepID=A0A0V0Z1H8_9BILA|nr:hypothetical protein T12_2067 [Trichinella patagoniensis]
MYDAIHQWTDISQQLRKIKPHIRGSVIALKS